MNSTPDLFRAALEERIRFGPETARSAEARLADRARWVGAADRAAALAEADRAVALAEALAREYQAGARTQTEVVAELRRRLPWLADEGRDGGGDLAERLGHFGCFLVIM